MAEAKRATDAFGAFSYLVYIAVGGFLVFGFAWSIRGAVQSQNESVCRALHPEHRNRIHGRVLDAAGNPVAGAEVIPIIDGNAAMPAKATEQGEFEIFMPEGEQTLMAQAPEKAPFETPIVLGRRESIDMEIRLEPEGSSGGTMAEQGRSIFEAPDLALQDLAGNDANLSDFRGKFVVLNFWATWCEPCTTEWPQVHQLTARLADREDDVAVVAISIDSERDAIWPYLGRMGLAQFDEASKQWSALTGVTVLWDPEQNAHKRFGTDKIPDTYFINEAGEVVLTYVNVRKWGAPEAFHCVDGSIGR